MDEAQLANTDQAAYWDGPANEGWLTDQVRLDAMFEPITDRLIEAAAVGGGQRVLDVGCGCGETTLLAARAAPGVSATGIDLSSQMLDRARGRASSAGLDRVMFARGDAQVERFDQPFERILSRFGLMFFNDPEAAFVNLAGQLAPEGRLTFVCWQDVLENDWMVVPAAAMIQHIGLGELNEQSTRPFSLADPDRIRTLLLGSGLAEVSVEPLIIDLLLGGPGTVDEVLEFVIRSGSGHLLLDGVEEPRRARAISALRATLEERHDGEGVRLRASVWIVGASSVAGG